MTDDNDGGIWEDQERSDYLAELAAEAIKQGHHELAERLYEDAKRLGQQPGWGEKATRPSLTPDQRDRQRLIDQANRRGQQDMSDDLAQRLRPGNVPTRDDAVLAKTADEPTKDLVQRFLDVVKANRSRSNTQEVQVTL